MSVFVRHGFHNLAERIRLGRFLIEKLAASDEIERYSIPERVRMSFEELGPTFVKLGQLLATRSDLVPEEYITEFEKLHDRVLPLPFSQIEEILKEEFGDRLPTIFASINPAPIGSASIAQVHRATLVTGEDVVIKVQRPGIIQKINDDLSVLYMLADLLERYVAETRPFRPKMMVDEFFKTLELETNFVVEANNLRRFAENFAPEKNPENAAIKIPKVYLDLTTERILVMEALTGIPISKDESLLQPGVDKNEVIRIGLRAYLKMVFIDGLFHGDLHAGNFFVMPYNHIGLIDFGVVGRINPRTQSAIANMLLALSTEDYERLAIEYVDLAPFTEDVNVDIFARQLRELVAPFYGLTLKSVNMGKILMTSASIAARQGLLVPTELMLFFKSLVAIEGLGRRIDPGFDFLGASLQFAGELAKHQIDPQKLLGNFAQVARDSQHLISALPREISFWLRKVNSPGYAARTEVRGFDDFKRSFEISFNLMFLGVIIASLILSASVIFTFSGEVARIAGMPALSFILYMVACALGLLAFYNYIKKS